MSTNQIEESMEGSFAEESECERRRIRTRLMRVVQRARGGEGR